MDTKFYGDLDDVSDHTIQKCKDYLNKRGIRYSKVKVQPVGKKGDNYVALVKRFTVQNENDNIEDNFKMVAKIATSNKEVRKLMQLQNLFKNECVVYTEVLPAYDEIQESVGLSKKEKLNHPECYIADLEDGKESIFLEDLQVSGFKILDRFKSLNKAEVELVLKDLSKFHALSYAYKQRDPISFESLKDKLKNIWVDQLNDDFKKYYIILETNAISALDNERHKKLIEGTFGDIYEEFVNQNKNCADSNYSVLIQGDCWTNNIMFRFEVDEPVEIILLDYQIVRITSPVVDIFYFLFNCTDQDFREKHFYYCLDFYYSSLKEYLSFYKLKIETVYPKDRFNSDLKHYARSMMANCVMLSMFLVRESDEVLEMKDMQKDGEFDIEALTSSTMKTETIQKFNKKVRGIVQSMVDFGYL